MKRLAGSKRFGYAVGTALASVGAGLLAYTMLSATPGPSPYEASWNAERAMNDIREQLRFTPRSLGSAGHEQTVHYILEQLRLSGNNSVVVQKWSVVGEGGQTLPMTNIVARLNPGNPDRVIVGTHYDSIVRAYADSANPAAPMPGANNSASGVALLLETIRAIGKQPSFRQGIDFVFFDGEEGILSLGAGDPQWAALGSPYFAKHLRDIYTDRLPRNGVIFDMVCYRNLRLRRELSSVRAAGAEVDRFWQAGREIAPDVFLSEPTDLPIGDDQSALSTAGIPSILVIDFDYAPWFNTTQDTIDKCSPQSLDVVGRTLLRYLHRL